MADSPDLQIDLRVAELLAGRLCHDLIGPVAAVANGAELLADEDPDFAQDAIALVGESARKANRRLQFFRFAFGFTGAGVTGPPPHQLAMDLFEDSPLSCEYGESVRALPVEQQKLACNMLATAAEPLARGGRIVISTDRIGPEVAASSEGSGLSAEIRSALSLAMPIAELSSRTVEAYFTGLLAKRLGFRIVVADQPGGFRVALTAD
jgi:histidine phosphotransferase ChpT